eukprot:4628502-Pleurochrysis_carterae.AAC.1
MFGRDLRWKQDPRTSLPGPGAYEPQEHNWDNAVGAGGFKATAERFTASGNPICDSTAAAFFLHFFSLSGAQSSGDVQLPGPGAYEWSTSSQAGMSSASRRTSMAPGSARKGEPPAELDGVLRNLRESLSVLRTVKASEENEQPPPSKDPETEVERLKQRLRGTNSKMQAQEKCITLCEAAIRVQEEAVGMVPKLVEREREYAATARARATEAAERVAALQAELDERAREEKRRANDIGLAQRRVSETEARVAALHAKQSESVKAVARLNGELHKSKRREEELMRQLKALESAA